MILPADTMASKVSVRLHVTIYAEATAPTADRTLSKAARDCEPIVPNRSRSAI